MAEQRQTLHREGPIVDSDRAMILAVDVGTTGTKCSAFDLRGRCAAESSVTHPTQYPQEGWVEQRSEDWISSVTAAAREVVGSLGRRASHLVAIGLTGQGGGVGFYDEEGRSLTPCLTWQDRRSQQLGETLLRELGPEHLGGALATTGFAAKLAWALQHWPSAVDRARWVLGAKELIGFWMTGKVCTDPKAHEWGTTVLEAVGFPRAKLPDELPPTHIVGRVRDDVAEAIGLPRDLPVANGLYDGACATLGAGAIDDGEGCITIGSNALARLVARTPISPRAGHAIGAFWYPLVEGRWLLGGFTNAGGLCLDWLAGTTAPSEESAITVLLAEAAQVPAGSDGVFFLPHLLGRGCPKWSANARAAFVGLSMRHRRGNLVRSVLEGVAYSLRGIYDALTAEGLSLKSVALTGGGAQGPLWPQIVSDVLQRRLTLCAGGSARGAAMLAAVAIGAHRDLRGAASAMLRCDAVVEPNDALSCVYAEGYQEFLEADERVVG